MAHKAAPLSQSEFEEIKDWLAGHQDAMPAHTLALFRRLMAVYEALAHKSRQASQTLQTLRTLMGILPSSEKGSQLANQP